MGLINMKVIGVMLCGVMMMCSAVLAAPSSERLTEDLNLSRKTLKEIRIEQKPHYELVKKLKARNYDLRQLLKDEILKETVDTVRVKQLKDEISANQMNMLSSKIESMKKLNKHLTDDQRHQLKENMRKRHRSLDKKRHKHDKRREAFRDKIKKKRDFNQEKRRKRDLDRQDRLDKNKDNLIDKKLEFL